MKNNAFIFLLFISLCQLSTNAQQITGFWKGRIDGKNVEVKIIKNGDSLTGTSYYYESPASYRRYSIRGYFDERDNSVVWWDDQLIEVKNSKRLFASKADRPYVSMADFNCPGGTKMYLTGNAALKEKSEEERGPVDLQKTEGHSFNDEWDFVIDNYTFGANDPDLIDSIGRLVFTKPAPLEPIFQEQTPPKRSDQEVVKVTTKKIAAPENKPTAEPMVPSKPNPVKETVTAVIPLNNEQKFFTRGRQLMQEIMISGDSLELTFYDNAEVDGDSIAIFLNNQLLYEHVRLSDKPYTIKLAVASLSKANELVMVAENLGSIPPNTSLMVAMVDGKRYEARLESTENSSALIRFIRKE